MVLSNTSDGGWKDRKKYYPIEWTALKLLGYLESGESKGPFSVNRLMRIKGMRWQRRDRIRSILSRFVELGWAEIVPGNPPRYRITDEGKMINRRFGGGVLKFLETFRASRRIGFRFPSGELC